MRVAVSFLCSLGLLLTAAGRSAADGADGTTLDVCGTISSYGRATTNILSLNVGGSLQAIQLVSGGNAPADLGSIGTALSPERVRVRGTVVAGADAGVARVVDFTITRVIACGLPGTSTWPSSWAAAGVPAP